MAGFFEREKPGKTAVVLQNSGVNDDSVAEARDMKDLASRKFIWSEPNSNLLLHLQHWYLPETLDANAAARRFLAPFWRQPFPFDRTGEKQINQTFVAAFFADFKTRCRFFDFQLVARMQILPLPHGLRDNDWPLLERVVCTAKR